MTNTSDIKHAFESLGAPPYRFVGFEVRKYQACHGAPIQCGGSCDYCGTGIMDTYWFVSSDGKRFKVGSDCVRKSGDAGLYSQIQRQINAVKTERRREREAEKIAAIRLQMGDETVRAKLATQPHPIDYRAKNGATLLNWADWMMVNAGNAGRLAVGKAIAKLTV